MNLNMLSKQLTGFRFFSIIAVLASGLGSLLMFAIGAIKVFRAYAVYFSDPEIVAVKLTSAAGTAIAFLVQAIDAFLIAIGLMVFGIGIFNLFIYPVPEEQRKLFGIESISQLKSLLADLVVIILIVRFLEEALHSHHHYTWDILVLPVGILLIAVAVRIIQIKDIDR